MKVRRKSGDPSPMAQRAAELSAKFAESRWSQSTQNFQPLAFVTHHGTFWVAAGFPPGRGCHSKACETDQEIIDWLNSFVVEPEAEPEPEPIPEPVTIDTPDAAVLVNTASEGPKEYPEVDAMADELEAARKRIAELEEKLAQAELPQPLPPDPTTKLSDYVPKEISDLMEPGETFTQARKRLSELLNVEKAELRLKRAAGSATEAELKREADVDRLQGLFSKLGEI